MERKLDPDVIDRILLTDANLILGHDTNDIKLILDIMDC